MRLYTYQTLDVISQLWMDKQYRPSWDRCVWLQDPIDKSYFEPPYRWLVAQYSERRTPTQDPLVWWYTTLKDARRALQDERGQALIGAEVPDEHILLHDFDLWHNCLGHNATLNICADEAAEKGDWERFDRWWDVYLKSENREAMKETWKHAFHLPKRDRHRRTVHAVTDCIRLEWVLEDNRDKGKR